MPKAGHVEVVAVAAAGSVVLGRCVFVLRRRASGLTTRCTGRPLSFVSARVVGGAAGVARELYRWAARNSPARIESL